MPPTNDRISLLQAVRTLTTSISTAIGSATLRGIDGIAEVNATVAPSGVSLARDGETPMAEDGGFLPDIIVLLTDGANTRGPLPVDAARQAADRQLCVYTIGFGTTEISEMVCTQEQLGSDSFNGGVGGGFDRGYFGPGGGR